MIVPQDYWYDLNGNMTKDDNKGITAISYNHLNLPTQVTLGGGNISYIYNATGVKQRKVVSTGATTDYAGNYVYENNNLQFFNHAEGYVNPELVSGSVQYNYVYQYKDHLGNVRLSYQDANNNGSVATNEIVEENNYYPFGLKHKGYNTVVNSSNPALKYKYNEKEFNDELGLNWYDYGWRNYAAAIGRWVNIDNLAERHTDWSPYAYVLNSPLRFIDPNGETDFWAISKDNGLRYLGNDGKDNDDIKIAQMDSKQMNKTSGRIRRIRKGKEKEGDSESIYGEDSKFVNLEIQSVKEQNIHVEGLQNSTAADGKEYGSVMSISFGGGKATLSFGEKVEGEKGYIPFSLKGSFEHLRDKNGNTVIGTIHSHTHNKGLSGQGLDEKQGAGDVARVESTQVPWFTVGPNTGKNKGSIHVGSIDSYGRFSHRLFKGTNILLETLNSSK